MVSPSNLTGLFLHSSLPDPRPRFLEPALCLDEGPDLVLGVIIQGWKLFRLQNPASRANSLPRC